MIHFYKRLQYKLRSMAQRRQQLLKRYHEEATQVTVMMPKQRAEMLLEKIEELETALRQERQEKMALRKEKLALTKKNQDLTEQNKIQKRRIDRMQTMSCDLAVFPTRTIQLFPSRRQLQEPWSSDPGMDTTNN